MTEWLSDGAVSLMVILCLVSYILFIFLVERVQLFSRAVCPKRVGDVSWA